jgi:hypothetical protein
MIRTSRHKLVRAHGQEDGELYDLLADPHELYNRWRQDDCVALRGDLLAALCDRIAFTADPLPQRRSSF